MTPRHLKVGGRDLHRILEGSLVGFCPLELYEVECIDLANLATMRVMSQGRGRQTVCCVCKDQTPSATRYTATQSDRVWKIGLRHVHLVHLRPEARRDAARRMTGARQVDGVRSTTNGHGNNDRSRMTQHQVDV